jgi:hypothetical protein
MAHVCHDPEHSATRWRVENLQVAVRSVVAALASAAAALRLDLQQQLLR